MALAAYGLGRPLIRGLRLGDEDRLSIGVWSVAAGLIVAGTLLSALGMAGCLYVPVIGVLTVSACFWGIGQMFLPETAVDGEPTQQESSQAESPDESPRPPWSPPASWTSGGVLLLAALACLGSLIAALAPPTAGDAVCYHLELPKAFLADHALRYLPYSENSTFPLLVEMWYLWGLAMDGGVTAQLVHWGLGVLLGLSAVVLATPIVGRPWAWIAGAAVVLTPGVNNQMTAPLNDVALALMTTLAFSAWWRAVVDGRTRRWFLLAGLAGGGALGTKYIAVVFALAVAIPAAWTFCRHKHRRRLLLEGAVVVSIVAVSIGGLWYLRAAWYRHNPVYPFLSEVFEGEDSDAAPEHQTFPESKSPLGRGPLSMATAAWHVTMQPERFGGRGHQLGVLLLAAVPGLLIVRRLRGLGTLLAAASVYCVIWFLLRQNVRFLLPAVPLMAVAMVWVWIETQRFPALPRFIVGITFTGVLAAYAAVALVRCDDQLAVAVGLESRQEYLSRHEPVWPAAEVMNSIFGSEAHLLSQDYRAFHFQCRVTRESVYRQRTDYDRQITEPEDFSRSLRQLGFTHILLAENLADRGISYDPTLGRLADAQQAADGNESLLNLIEYRFADADGGLRRYRLLMIR